MRKVYLTLILLIAATATTFAQNPLPKGDAQLNMGVGLSNRGIPVYFGFDYGVHKDITIGAELSYRGYNDRFNNSRYKHSIFGISGNANYHFNHVLKIPTDWDFYAGLNLGFYHWNSDDNYPGDFNSGVGIGAQVGGRYFFTDSFGINLEFGGNNAFSGGKFGITVKL
ncbi:MAG: outer membrane beta-barrel protein [Flavobacteriaceae bacterium]